jgi:TonB-linked SusC/RagA family outer membrane protein
MISKRQTLPVMRMTAVFMLAACLQVTARGVSQRITLQRKNASMENVLEDIEQQSGYQFFFKSSLEGSFKKVSIHVKDAPLSQVLETCFKDQPLTYTIVDKTIVLRPKTAQPETMSTQADFQPLSIHLHGKILDEKGNPMEGVSVRIKGSDHGATTDKSGEYALEVPEGATLVFSYIGYDPVTENVSNRKEINLSMHPNATGLSDVVVVGYGSQKQANITNSVTTVKMDEVLGDRPVSNVSELMMNAVPGLNVSVPSGQPGSATSINLRGATDLNTSGSTINTGAPLIVMDNVPFNGPLNMIDPNDIETLTVLNDAGSAAIYGGRSAFGVILITTKKGRKNQAPQFNFSNNVTIAHAYNLPVKASPDQFFQSLEDMGTTSYWSGQNVALWKQLYDSIHNPAAQFPNGVDYIGGVGYPLVPTDMVKDFLGKSAPQTQTNFSVYGGSDKITYRLAFGNTNEKGIIIPSANMDYFKRYNLTSSISSDLNKWLTTQLNTSYYNSVTSTPSENEFGDAVNFPILAPVSDSLAGGNGIMGINGTPRNIATMGGSDVNKNSDIRLTGRGIIKPFKDLTITGEYTYDNLQSNSQIYVAGLNVVNPTNFQTQNRGGTGTYTVDNGTTIYKSVNLYANYLKSFGSHNLGFMAGYNQEQDSYTFDSVSKTSPITPELPSLTTSTGNLLAGDIYSAYSLFGYFGRINYDYKGKYLLELNGRYDGSSKFPSDHQFGFFPSGSAGWVVTREGFMAPVKSVLSNLKLRGSYGSVGNQNINPYAFIPTMQGNTPGWLNSNSNYLTSLTTPGLISTSFTWERVETTDLGTDFGFFANRFTGSFDWYRRNTNHILAAGATPLPAVLGAQAPLENTASLRTQGYTIQLNFNDHIGKDIRYHVGFNIADNKGVITRFDGNPTKILSSYYVGQHMGEIWGYTTDRFYTSADFVPGSLNNNLMGGTLQKGVTTFQGEAPNPGDIKYVAYNGHTVVGPGANTVDSSGDQRIIGNSTPRYIFGLNGGISYKNFSFSFVVTGVGKQELNMQNNLTFPNYYPFGTLYANQMNYWTPTHTNAFYGRIYDQAAGNQGNNEKTQTRFLQNGAYLRINNLTLDYAIPSKILQAVRIKTFHVFCSVEDPFFFDHLPRGLEPGLTNQAYGLQYPYLRRESCGVNLTF